MILQSVFHIEYTPYRYFLSTKACVLRLRIDRRDEDALVYLVYKSATADIDKFRKTRMDVRFKDELFTYFEATVTLSDLSISYYFEIKKDDKVLYYTEDGFIKNIDDSIDKTTYRVPFVAELDVFNHSDTNITSLIAYYLNIDSFYRSKSYGDDNNEYEMVDGFKKFHPAFLKGLIEKLPYIKSLGVSDLIIGGTYYYRKRYTDSFDAYYIGNKKQKPDPYLVELIESIHANKLDVTLEIAVNDLPIEHPFFQDVIKNGYNSKYYNWFFIDGSTVNLNEPNYVLFDNEKTYAKLNTSNIHVQDYIIDKIRCFFNTYNVDALKLSQYRETSHNFMRRLHYFRQIEFKDKIILSENNYDNLSYFDGHHFDISINFTVIKTLIKYLSFNSFTTEQFANYLNTHMSYYSDNIYSSMINCLTSPLLGRYYNLVRSNMDHFVLSQAFVFLSAGVPMIFAGDEIPLRTPKPNDLHSTFDWDLLNEKSTLFITLQKLARLKSTFLSKYEKVYIKYEDNKVIFERFAPTGNIIAEWTKEKAKVNVDVKDVLSSYNYADGEINCGFVVYKQLGKKRIIFDN